MNAAESLKRRARWRWPEIVFWLVAFGALFVPSGKHLILNEVAIFALFALSLDLILGYAGIVSLGHAAFFGVGMYATADLTTKLGWPFLATLPIAAAIPALLALGITITARVPSLDAPNATPWAWLPAEAQITPRLSCSGLRCATLL